MSYLKTIILVIVLLAATAVGTYYYFYFNKGGTSNNNNPATNTPQSTQSAKTKVPPDSELPTAGTCLGPDNSTIVSVTFAPDNVPQPRCSKVTSSQKLQIVNNSGHQITGAVGSYTINVGSGQSQTIDAP